MKRAPCNDVLDETKADKLIYVTASDGQYFAEVIIGDPERSDCRPFYTSRFRKTASLAVADARQWIKNNIDEMRRFVKNLED